MWKKVVLCAIMVLVLCGCKNESRKPTQKALDLRTTLLEAGGCTFTADIEAAVSDRIYAFSVSCDYTVGEKAVITILQPDVIEGIRATVTDTGAKVDFEGVSLDFGTLAEGRLSAMEAGFCLAQCWTDGYISAAGPDGDLHRITYLDGFDDGELTVDTWLDSQGIPLRGEITYDGLRCLTLDITQFQLKT